MTEADIYGPFNLHYAALHRGLDAWERSCEVGSSFLQGPEGVLHVLQQLGEVCFDLSFTILNRVLRRSNEHEQVQNR